MPDQAPALRTRERIDYIDVLRGLAMYAVYVGHFAELAGPLSPFVYRYHVALFFFVAGGMERFSRARPFGEYVRHKARGVLLPWLLFALASVAIFTLSENSTLKRVLLDLLTVAKGCVVNSFYASALWFLTGLFVMSLLFYWLKKLRGPVWIMAVVLLCHAAATQFYPQMVAGWYWNLGGVMKYLVYYAAGYLCFPALHRFVTNESPRARLAFAVTGALACGYGVLAYLGKDALNRLPEIAALPWYRPLLSAFILIYANVAVAYLLRGVLALQRVGRETLFLCGSEFFVSLFPAVLRQIGLHVTLTNPLMTALYAALLMGIAAKWLVPAEKRVVGAMNARLDRAAAERAGRRERA